MLPKINGQPVKVVVVGAGASGIASGVMLEVRVYNDGFTNARKPEGPWPDKLRCL